MKEIDNQFVINYTPILNRIAKHYTNNKWDFEDCRQELYLKLLECLQVYDINKGVPLEIFVKICCTHKAISFAKNINKYNQTEVLLEEDEEFDDNVDLVEGSVRDIYEYFINNYKSHSGGELVKQKYLEGYTTKELANKNKVSTRTIDKKIKKFNRWFKKEFEKD